MVPARLWRPNKLKQHAERVDGKGMLGNARLHKGSIPMEHPHKPVELEFGGGGIDDEVEVVDEGGEGGGIACRVVIVRSERLGELALAGAVRESGDMGAHRAGEATVSQRDDSSSREHLRCELDANVAKTAYADDCNSTVGPGLPVAKGGEHGDTGALVESSQT